MVQKGKNLEIKRLWKRYYKDIEEDTIGGIITRSGEFLCGSNKTL